MLQEFFQLQENGTTVRRELLAGLTTFTAMAYVVVVNPRILSEAGMPADGVLFATCISAALATLGYAGGAAPFCKPAIPPEPHREDAFVGEIQPPRCGRISRAPIC